MICILEQIYNTVKEKVKENIYNCNLSNEGVIAVYSDEQFNQEITIYNDGFSCLGYFGNELIYKEELQW